MGEETAQWEKNRCPLGQGIQREKTWSNWERTRPRRGHDSVGKDMIQREKHGPEEKTRLNWEAMKQWKKRRSNKEDTANWWSSRSMKKAWSNEK